MLGDLLTGILKEADKGHTLSARKAYPLESPPLEPLGEVCVLVVWVVCPSYKGLTNILFPVNIPPGFADPDQIDQHKPIRPMASDR